MCSHRIEYSSICAHAPRKRQKFRGLLGSSGMRGKVSRFFPSPPSYIHGFPTLQNSYECFNESFAFLTWILLKTVISIYSEMDKSTLLTQVCADFSFPRWPCSHRRRSSYTVEVSPRQNSWITNCFLVSVFCKLLPNPLEKPSRFFATTVKYFRQIFHHVNFSGVKV